MKTVKYKEWDCTVSVARYVSGNPAIRLMDAEDGQPVMTATVNLPGLAMDEIALDTNNGGQEIIKTIKDAELIKEDPIRSIKSGYCDYPVFKLKT